MSLTVLWAWHTRLKTLCREIFSEKCMRGWQALSSCGLCKKMRLSGDFGQQPYHFLCKGSDISVSFVVPVSLPLPWYCAAAQEVAIDSP